MSLSKLFFRLLFLQTFIFVAANSLAQEVSSHSSIEFIENKGQIVDMNHNSRPDILFVGDEGAGKNTKGAKIFLRKTGVSYVITKATPGLMNVIEKKGKNIGPRLNTKPETELLTVLGHRVDIDFIGANTNIIVENENPIEGYNNYYLPNRKIENVLGYRKVTYKNIYNQVDVVFESGKSSGMKYNFIVAPGGNPDEIKMEYKGVNRITLEQTTLGGNLIVETSIGNLTEYMPRVYQVINERIVDVTCEYKLDKEMVSFVLGKYNKNEALIIDPWVTYIGGSDDDMPGAITKDHVGDIIICGSSRSGNYPTSTGAFQSSMAGVFDVVVTKFSPNGNRMWSTYYGGSEYECPHAIITNSNNDIYFCGETESDNLPITAGAFQTKFGGKVGYYPRGEAFIVKLNSMGNMGWASYYGGSNDDGAFGISVDANNNIVMIGSTASTDIYVSRGAYQQKLAGYLNAFVTKFSPTGNVIWSTYFGGNVMDYGESVAVDKNNNINITGETVSNTFPVTAGAFQSVNYGNQDIFIAQLNSSGMLNWCTMMGGYSFETSQFITVDNSNDIFVAGNTNSYNFPVTAGAYSTLFKGVTDAHLTKFSNNGVLQWSTYYNNDTSSTPSVELYSRACVTDDLNNVFLLTEMEDIAPTGGFPDFACAYQKNFVFSSGTQVLDDEDQMIIKFSSAGNFICGTFLGGAGEDDLDQGGGIIYDKGSLYILTGSKGKFPVTAGAYQTNHGGGEYDMALAKICSNSCGDERPKALDFALSDVGCNMPFNLSETNNACDQSSLNWTWSMPGANVENASGENVNGVFYSKAGTYNITLALAGCGGDAVIKTINVSDGCDVDVVVEIPNVFTPNGDGRNEEFRITTAGLKKYHLQIFNRWGTMVFETEDANQHWKGLDASAGTYYYTLDVEASGDNSSTNYKGFVTVVK